MEKLRLEEKAYTIQPQTKHATKTVHKSNKNITVKPAPTEDIQYMEGRNSELLARYEKECPIY